MWAGSDWLVLFQAIDLPAATYPLSDSIPSDTIMSGRLSSLQLEGILYAVCRAYCNYGFHRDVY